MPIGIGFFQLDNLVKNRVPFFLLKDETDIEKFFGPMERIHLRTYSIPLQAMSLSEAEAQMKERGAQMQSPVVVFCQTGKPSQKLAEDLEKQGYMNIYYVLDGVGSFTDT